MADTPRIEELKRRVRSDPASIAFAALAEEYRRAGRFDEAIDTCITGLQRHPSYLSAHVTLGRALIEVGRYDDAREELELVLRVAPENLAAIRGLAEIHHRRGESHETAAFAEVKAESNDASAFAAEAVSADGCEPTTPAIPVPAPVAERPVEVASWTIDAASTAGEPPQPAPDPVLSGLENLLAAIVRARSTHEDVRR